MLWELLAADIEGIEGIGAVQEGLLLIQVVFTKKGADEAKRNRR